MAFRKVYMAPKFWHLFVISFACFLITTISGCGGVSSGATIPTPLPPTVTLTATPSSILPGQSAVLTVSMSRAAQVVISNNVDSTTYTLTASGTQIVTPSATTTYSATATGTDGQTASARATVTIASGNHGNPINHVIFMQQENRSFDTYFGMLNPYRRKSGWNVGDDGITYDVDGIDDKLTDSRFINFDDEGDPFSLFKFTTTCIDDETSAWLESYGDVNRYDFSSNRAIQMNGFVHTAEGFAKFCSQPGATCSGSYSDLQGKRAMGYYDEDFLSYYYYMASQFAISDRWFSPVSSKSVSNRLATFTGGTTQGLVRDPGTPDDHLGQLNIETIFHRLDNAGVTWRVYYTVTIDECLAGDTNCSPARPDKRPATDFSYFSDSRKYLYSPSPAGAPCSSTTQGSAVVGDTTNSFCIDTDHLAPVSRFFTDVNSGKLPSFAFIEAGYGHNDEHPGSGQSILTGQTQVARLLNALMTSPSWSDSVFFFSYDEGGGPFDHVPPVPGQSNTFTAPSLGITKDIASIAVNADAYKPCVPPGGVPTTHCDLKPSDPGANAAVDAVAVQGFAAQLGFRLPNIIVSPFTRKHYVSHTPMDHTAVIKFVEDRFIGNGKYLTARDAAQPDLLEFFDFGRAPWMTPPMGMPVPPQPLGSCHPGTLGP